MKRLAVAVICSIAVLIGTGLLALLLLPSDEVESSYATLDAARKDELFGRGWLPDILPPSATQIRVSNNLDLNTSSGEFNLNPAEWHLLQTKLVVGAVLAPFVGWNEEVEGHRRDGFLPWHYSEGSSNWVFFCSPGAGQCKYVMWTRREG